MLQRRHLVRDLAWFTTASMSKLDQRQDSDELLAWLGLSAPQVLDEKQLRKRLLQIAHRITHEKVQELAALLGHPILPPAPGLVAQWIDDQVFAVQTTIENWLVSVAEEVRRAQLAGAAMSALTVTLRELQQQVAGAAERKASVAVLQLNAQIIEETARGAGSSHYRWETEQDDRVRAWHASKQGHIYAWEDPPLGGGSHADDYGHPGSGYGCRCIPVPIQGPLR
jgi:hypothetical protein